MRVRLEKWEGPLGAAAGRQVAWALEGSLRSSELLREWAMCESSDKALWMTKRAEDGIKGAVWCTELGWPDAGVQRIGREWDAHRRKERRSGSETQGATCGRAGARGRIMRG